MLRLIHRLLIRPNDANGNAPSHSYLRRDAAPMRPDRAEEVSIDLLPTSYVFRRGHQIQIAIAGGDTAHFREMAGPSQPVTILFGGTHPSRVDLPVVSR
jgi:predicted acyl esterase